MLRTALAAILFGSVVLLLVRVWFGPIAGLISARSTLNVEAVAFLAFCGFLLTSRSSRLSAPLLSQSEATPWVWIAAVALATSIAFAPSIGFPFLFDDYRHLMFAFGESPSALFARVVVHHPTVGDLFFRPLGDFLFEWLYQAFHFDFRLWHAAGLLLHVANTLLVVWLAKNISGCWFGALAGGLFFGWQASHVEAVSWSSALYDLLAAFFVLLALLELIGRRSSVWRYSWLAGLSVLACVSKESSFCLPLLAAILVALVPAESRTLAAKKALCVAAACVLVLAYRSWYLQGLGGYQASAGGSLAANFRFLSAAQALTLRLWAILFVPLNWSVPPGLALRIAFVCLAGALLGFAKYGCLATRRTALLAAFTLCAALPALSLLLIGYDLAGARVLYLPSAGIALLWAEIAESVPNRKHAAGLCALLLAFQLAALQHNQELWGPVAWTARQACIDAGALLRTDPRATVFALNLPRAKNGVYFLQNAFPYCVAANASVNSFRVSVGTTLPPAIHPDQWIVTWDDFAGRLVARKP